MTTRQLELFANQTRILPCDTHVTAPEEPRLTSQNGRILALLRQRPATNLELSRISIKYTSRISDLRAAGFHIEVQEHDKRSGRVVYQLRQ